MVSLEVSIKDEFDSDGVEVLSGAALREVRRIMRLTSSTPKETIYTSAGALRMGFILRDSEVAKTVRTAVYLLPEGYWQHGTYSTKIVVVIEGWRFETAQEWCAITNPEGYLIAYPTCPFPPIDYPTTSTDKGDFVHWDNSIEPQDVILHENILTWWHQKKEEIEQLFEKKISQSIGS